MKKIIMILAMLVTFNLVGCSSSTSTPKAEVINNEPQTVVSEKPLVSQNTTINTPQQRRGNGKYDLIDDMRRYPKDHAGEIFTIDEVIIAGFFDASDFGGVEVCSGCNAKYYYTAITSDYERQVYIVDSDNTLGYRLLTGDVLQNMTYEFIGSTAEYIVCKIYEAGYTPEPEYVLDTDISNGEKSIDDFIAEINENWKNNLDSSCMMENVVVDEKLWDWNDPEDDFRNYGGTIIFDAYRCHYDVNGFEFILMNARENFGVELKHGDSFQAYLTYRGQALDVEGLFIFELDGSDSAIFYP